MACGGVPYEENFWCCICLDLFTHPVTLPCGHNFCKMCITQHWNCSQTYQCPLCKEHIPRNIELRVNTILCQMSQQMQTSAKEPTRGGNEEGEEDDRSHREGGVSCDVCERKAVKSCLICFTSFCGEHLAPHYKSPGLRRHHLIEPVKNLEQRTCQKHNRPLRFFCHSDQTCICQFCAESEHSRHAVVSLDEEGAEKRRQLSKLQDRICEMTTERRGKMELLKRAGRIGEHEAAESVRDCVQAVFKATRSLEKGLSQLLETIERKQNEAERQTAFYVSQLEEEICELVRAKAELEENKNASDNFQLVQNFESLQILPRTLDLSEVEVCTFHRGVVDEVVKKMDETVVDLDKFWMGIELKRAQQFAVDTVFDASTFYPLSSLSANGKQFEYGGMEISMANNPEMFSKHQQSLYFANFYFDVTVGDVDRWNLGVVLEKSDKRSGQILRPEHGFWVIRSKDGVSYGALTEHADVKLKPSTKPRKIGVWVDYDTRRVSFYNSETAEKIYTFEECEFTGRVFPYSERALQPKQKKIVVRRVR